MALLFYKCVLVLHYISISCSKISVLDKKTKTNKQIKKHTTPKWCSQQRSQSAKQQGVKSSESNSCSTCLVPRGVQFLARLAWGYRSWEEMQENIFKLNLYFFSWIQCLLRSNNYLIFIKVFFTLKMVQFRKFLNNIECTQIHM